MPAGRSNKEPLAVHGREDVRYICCVLLQERKNGERIRKTNGKG